MNKYESKLTFKNYIVKNISFENNEEFSMENNVDVNFDIDADIKHLENNMFVTLIVDICKKIEGNYPFIMHVEVKGLFEIIDNVDNINFEPHAIAILYPYIRSLITTYTSNANIMPLILPTINVNKLLEDKRKTSKN